MLFNSLIFIYLFLPVTILLSIIVPARFRNHLLLLASLVFYSWGGIPYLMVLVGSILLNYTTGLFMKFAKNPGRRNKLFIAAIVLNLLLLGVFKYTNFTVNNVNVLTGLFGLDPFYINNIVLPLGISFYTFKAITFLVSIKDDTSVQGFNLVDFALYLSLFPQVIAGPIDRYQTLMPQIQNRTISFQKMASGIRKFTLGLFKKVIISSPLAYVADQIFSMPADQLSTPLVWLGAVSYTLQVYYDFSGYTDMAIGLGRFFGFEFSENFNFPYISRSIREFWQRWHITLSTWLRDFLFQPLAYSSYKNMKRASYFGFSKGTASYIYATLITFLLCGLWHGAAWTFIFWGLMHGLLLSLEKAAFGKWMDKTYRPLGHIYFILSMLLTFVIFRSSTLSQAFGILGIMFGFGGTETCWPGMLEYIDRRFILILLLAISGSTPVFANFYKTINTKLKHQKPEENIFIKYGFSMLMILGIFFVLILSTMNMVSDTNNSFIYFNF